VDAPDEWQLPPDRVVDLKGRSVRGGAVLLISRIARFILSAGSTVALARLLTPADFGLIAMVLPITGFIQRFNDFGLSLATVQRDRIAHEQVSALFWVNVGIGTALMVLGGLMAPLAGLFYREPRVVPVMLVLSGLFIVSGLTAQHRALLIRQMRYAALARVEIGGLTAGIAAGFLGAWYGLAHWALVLM